jgi:hypothetical protein
MYKYTVLPVPYLIYIYANVGFVNQTHAMHVSKLCNILSTVLNRTMNADRHMEFVLENQISNLSLPQLSSVKAPSHEIRSS